MQSWALWNLIGLYPVTSQVGRIKPCSLSLDTYNSAFFFWKYLARLSDLLAPLLRNRHEAQDGNGGAQRQKGPSVPVD